MNRHHASPTTIKRLFVVAALLAIGMAAGDDLQSRRQRIRQMSANEKQELLGKLNRFEELPRADQDELRDLYIKIQQQPDHERLMRVLASYYQWLKSLSPSQRAELTNLSPEERLTRIQKLLADQEDIRFRRMLGDVLQPEDREIIHGWLKELVERKIDEFPADQVNWVREAEDEENRYRRLLFVLMRSGMLSNRDTEANKLSKEDEQALTRQLSTEAQDVLKSLNDPEDRSRAMRYWISVAIFSRMRPKVDHETLTKFALEKLDSKTRERLETLPRDKMLRELEDLYWNHQARQRSRWGDSTGNRGGRGRGGRGSSGRGGPPGRGGPAGRGAPGIGGPGERSLDGQPAERPDRGARSEDQNDSRPAKAKDQENNDGQATVDTPSGDAGKTGDQQETNRGDAERTQR